MLITEFFSYEFVCVSLLLLFHSLTFDTVCSGFFSKTLSLCFMARSQNYKSDYQLRLLSVSVRPHGTTRLPLDGFT